jgi:hypothetical protein
MWLLEGSKVIDRRILTYSGKLIDIFDLKPEDICLEDIVHHLALRNRFSGATREPYSVAQHCCLAAIWAVPPLLKSVALLHDAEEAYIPDIPGPWKDEPIWDKCFAVGKNIRFRIWDKYLPGLKNETQADYHWIDHQLCIAEIRFLIEQGTATNLGREMLNLVPPSGWTWDQLLDPWPWQEAERTFLTLAAVLGIKD